MSNRSDNSVSNPVPAYDAFGYGEVRDATARCITFADVRGDFRLLFTLLTQIMEVAKLENGHWQWTTTDTTIVCLGNFVDRFGQKGFNRLLMNTQRAIQDEVRIIETFKELAVAADRDNKGNAVVVLMGDHELGNLLHWEHYQKYQMAKPQDEADQNVRAEFIETILKPFALTHGLVARWGMPGGTVYFSHAGLDLEWFKRFKPKSIPDLNQQWQRWLRQNNFARLSHFVDDNSPVLSPRMAIQPQLWREYDEETILKVLGEDPNPKFVQAGIPIQIMKQQSWDPYLRVPRCDDVKWEVPTMLASRSPDGVDQIYFIHNAMADVFCMYDDSDRKPQALQFELHVNGNDQALYLSCKILVMGDDEYRIYLDERPFGSCAVTAGQITDQAEIKLSEDEIASMHPVIDEEIVVTMEQQTQHVKYVGLILFSRDFKNVFLMKERKTNKWTLPLGKAKTGISAWQAMKHMVAVQSGMKQLKFMSGGSVTDFEGDTRVWLKRTRQALEFHPNEHFSEGRWVAYDGLMEEVLSRKTKLLLCVLMRENMLWMSRGFQECPEWLTQEPVPKSHEGTWWEKDFLMEK
jgi:hypothetical protein